LQTRRLLSAVAPTHKTAVRDCVKCPQSESQTFVTQTNKPHDQSIAAPTASPLLPRNMATKLAGGLACNVLITLVKMVPQKGFEPLTPSLRMMCSTG
jgi:hypothetical protein